MRYLCWSVYFSNFSWKWIYYSARSLIFVEPLFFLRVPFRIHMSQNDVIRLFVKAGARSAGCPHLLANRTSLISHLMRLWHFWRILQTRMRSYSVGIDAWLLVGSFVYSHTSCVRTAKALARLCGCADSPEPSLVAHVVGKCHNLMSWLIY